MSTQESAHKPTSKEGILDRIVADKRVALEVEKVAKPLQLLKEELATKEIPLKDFPFESALRQPKNTHLIAEIKPSSPSAGVLQAEVNLDAILEAYNDYASAISVLTDAPYFGGTFERLAEVSRRSPRPTLCKDFVIDEYMVYQARLAGAAAVLLIVKILDDAALKSLYDCIQGLGMTAVVEVQNENELQRALAIGASVLLINNRNLSTFDVDLATTTRLADVLSSYSQKPSPLHPGGRGIKGGGESPLIISASGIEKRADIEALLPATNCFLIGSSLMKQSNKTLPILLQELLSITN
jgi:indole-3-glycerol phosphate synthase